MPKKLLWSPSTEYVKNSIPYAFMQAVNQYFSLSLRSYDDLYQWSITNKEHFWKFWAQYSHFPFFSPYSSVILHSETMEQSQWFPGSTTNYTKKALGYAGELPALIAYDETGYRRELSRNQLVRLVISSIEGLKKAGIQQGDRVAAYMPNAIETIVMFLACASIGAIWSSCSPDFGTQGVIDRFGQITPRLLLTIDGYHYAGKSHDITDKAGSIVNSVPSIETVVIVPFLDKTSRQAPSIRCATPVYTWEEFIASGRHSQTAEPEIIPVPFDHPLYILYSSGTTGVPKCIVHGHGGSLIQHMKEHQLHTNIKENDRVFYFTTCGWMMWNWLVSTLASGACAVLYDGSPFYPGPEKLWEIAEKEKINVFGTGAKYISSLSKAPYYPEQHHDLSHLHTVLSTGSPLAPADFDFVYQHIKQNICLSSISGGTDIVSCFVLGSPMLPVYRGQIQCCGLGMDISFLDDNQEAHTGIKGELVCRQSFPSMPVAFWNDPDNKKYHNTYFSRFNNMWAHGDYGEITPEHGVILHGRSDTTLNPGGVRIGTAEIYRQVEKLSEIQESMAVGQKWKEDERIILFVILQQGQYLTSELQQKIRAVIRENTSPRHVPAKIIKIDDFPRTRSGKVSESAVKAVINNKTVKNAHALANSNVLASYRNLEALQE